MFTDTFAPITVFIQTAISHPTWDIIVGCALIAVGFFYGISAGHKKIASSIIYTYVTFALFTVLPIDTFAGIGGVTLFWARVGAFLLLFLSITFLLRSDKRKDRFLAFPGSWWQSLVLSFLQTGLLLHIIFSFLPPDIIATLAPLTKYIFAADNLRIVWFVAPVLILIFFRRIFSN